MRESGLLCNQVIRKKAACLPRPKFCIYMYTLEESIRARPMRAQGGPKGPSPQGPGEPTRAQGGPQLGPQGPREGHKGPVHMGPGGPARAQGGPQKPKAAHKGPGRPTRARSTGATSA